MNQLLDDLTGREVVLEAHGARGAEFAAHFATDLRGNAECGPGTAGAGVAVVFTQTRVVVHDDGLDESAVLELDEELGGDVVGGVEEGVDGGSEGFEFGVEEGIGGGG